MINIHEVCNDWPVDIPPPTYAIIVWIHYGFDTVDP